MSASDRSNYENSQVKSIVEWKDQEPSVVSKGLGLLSMPFEFVVQKIIPDGVVQAILTGANSAGEFLADENDIIRDGNVTRVEELRGKNLKLSDDLANEVHNWAIGIAGVEGGAAGAFGGFGIAADIPALLTLALRTIHKIGLCYGYKANTEEEKKFVLSIMSAAGANTQKEKREALIALHTMYGILQKQAWRKIAQSTGKEAVMITAIKNLCKQLGINLSKRKALQAIPVLGGVIGASVNASYIRDVGYAARRIYQERWLTDNNKMDE